MPNMIDDGFLDSAQFVRQVSLLPGNQDYALQQAVAVAVGNAAVSGLFTCTVNVAPYANALVQLIIERLVNLGFAASLTNSTTLSVTWS